MHPYQTELRPHDPRYGAFPTPTPPPAPPGPARGVPVFVWVLVAAAVLIVGLAVSFGVGIAVGARAGRHSPSPSLADDPSDRGTGAGNASSLPTPSRDVPSHDTSLLDGCTSADLDLIETRIDKAIALGAPTYNRGDFQGCFSTYERTARDLESSLPASCKGPATALASGRAKAATEVRASDKAWAMRDAFDGLLDVIDRSR